MDSSNRSPVRDSYTGKRILVIGATGFLGKIIVERLLREVPGIDRIDLLIRRNPCGAGAQSRIRRDLLGSALFADLCAAVGQDRYDELTGKLYGVTGDVTRPGLGLDDAAHRSLSASVDLVVNVAATVNFREPLDRALKTNTDSIDEILALAAQRNMPILHVSTCFVNGFHRGMIDETVREPANVALRDHPDLVGGQAVRAKAAYVSDRLRLAVATADGAHDNAAARNDAMSAIGQRLAREFGWNDCYTMTKWLAEQRLLERRPQGPVTILRPSIIESTLSQPFGGWIEGIKVADAVIHAYARHGTSVFPGRADRIIDIIPADRVANAILLAGAELLDGPAETRIYQSCSSAQNPLKIGRLRDIVVDTCRAKRASLPRLVNREPGRLHFLPAPVFDVLIQTRRVCLRLGRWLSPVGAGFARRLERIDKARALTSLYAFYTSPGYVFSNRRLTELHASFPASDRARLPVDVAGMDWRHYIGSVHLPGLHRHALDRRRRSRTTAAGTTPAASAARA